MPKTLDLERSLEPLVQPFSGRVSIALHRFSDGAEYEREGAARLPAASLIKLPILVTALHAVGLGRLRLESRLTLTEERMAGGNGVLKSLQPGLSLTLQDLLTLMVIVSDNTATNMVIEEVGLETINYHCEALGLAQTQLVGLLQVSEAKQTEAQRAGERNSSSAQDILTLLVRLVQGELLTPALTDLALNILKQQLYTEGLARYLPTDLERDRGALEVASKSGCLRGIWHDAGVVLREGQPRYALVVMTAEAQDESYGWEQEGVMLIAGLSKRVYDALR